MPVELCQMQKGITLLLSWRLAVVWYVSHFHSYLYGHDVTVHTNHMVVKLCLVVKTSMANIPGSDRKSMSQK